MTKSEWIKLAAGDVLVCDYMKQGKKIPDGVVVAVLPSDTCGQSVIVERPNDNGNSRTACIQERSCTAYHKKKLDLPILSSPTQCKCPVCGANLIIGGAL